MLPNQVIIVNAKAGSAAQVPDLESMFKENSEIVYAERGSQVVEAAQRLLKAGTQRLVAAGGDGTVAAVANAILTHSPSAVLGILPLGTGNDFARGIGIPLDVPGAVETLRAGTITRVDTVEVRTGSASRFMLNVATGGTSTEITRNTTRKTKQKFKAWSYVLNAWRSLFRRRTFHITATLDGVVIRCRALNVIVANGSSCGGGFTVAPRASMTDHWLDVIIVRPSGVMDLFRMAWKLLRRDLRNDPKLLEMRCRTLRLQSVPPFTFSIDGEVGTQTPVDFNLRPESLAVLVPSEAAQN